MQNVWSQLPGSAEALRKSCASHISSSYSLYRNLQGHSTFRHVVLHRSDFGPAMNTTCIIYGLYIADLQ